MIDLIKIVKTIVVIYKFNSNTNF